MKEFADDNFKWDENGGKFSKRVQNIVRKGEIAAVTTSNLSYSPQCFEDLYCKRVKTSVCLAKGTHTILSFAMMSLLYKKCGARSVCTCV